jgi:hypothetical protein
VSVYKIVRFIIDNSNVIIVACEQHFTSCFLLLAAAMEFKSEVRIRKWLEIPSGSKDNEDFSDGDSIADPVFNLREYDSDINSGKFTPYAHDHMATIISVYLQIFLVI